MGIQDIYGLPYNNQSTKTFYLTFSDFIYYSQSQTQSAESTKKYSSEFSYVLQWMFVSIYLFNIGKTFALTYEFSHNVLIIQISQHRISRKSEFIL